MAGGIFDLLLGHPALSLGWLIVSGLTVQVGLQALGGVRRLYQERRHSELARRRLLLDIKAAELRIEREVQAKLAWNGVRKFTVAKKILEASDTCSFHLEPHDGKPLPSFKPGQYLTFQLAVPGLGKPLVRCYSLSDCGRSTHYRVTIKRCLPPPKTEHPPGVGSSFFHDSVKEGDILDVKAPAGHFFLDVERRRPVVLISGGIGVTPMVTMANALLEAGDTREIWFFFGARNGSDHMFKDYMNEIAARHENVRMHVCYSKPAPTDVKGRDYQHEGRVSVELFKQLLASNNYDYFLCGPGPFMETITTDLAAWGVPDDWVHFEAFGPASVKRKAPPKAEAATAAPVAAIEVTFAKSGKRLQWDGAHDSVLEFAEANGVKIDAGCRAGNCGTCLVAIKSGEVEYSGNPGAESERGTCLTCICKPKGGLVLDA